MYRRLVGFSSASAWETPLRNILVSLAIAAALATSAIARAAAPADGTAAPAPEAERDGAVAPIDCPLHQGGVDPKGMRPFAETEKWIEYLDKPERAEWQKPDAVVKALGLQGSETVADLGAGSGYFTFRFAKALRTGKVVATDVDPEMVRHMHRKVMAEHLANVRVVLTDPKDPGIPSDADVAFVCDVIHHVADRDARLHRGFEEMKPGARLVVIEFKEGKLPQGPPEAVKIPKAKLVSMLEGVGFKLRLERRELLPYQHFLVFEKPAAAGR